MAEVLKLYFNDKLPEEIDKLAIKLYPKNQVSYRCCIHKDRAVTRYRIMGILGMSIEDETDETITLADYAKKALAREKITEPVLTVIDDACSSCVKAQYMVTNVCRGCLARPCAVNCPKKAVTFSNKHAKIDPDKCVNCGICKNVCPYGAIVRLSVPCEESCPVGAISKDESGKESIDYSKCIYCGKCTRGCPFSAIVEKTQLIDVAKHLKNNKETIVMVAPSIAGQFNGTMKNIVGAMKALGFTKVIEVAQGADTCTREEAHEFIERMKKGEKQMGTSCCPAYTEAVKKHAPEFQQYVSKSRTPMSYTAEEVVHCYPHAIKVFIGPCIAKKFEGIYDKNVDYVLTFEELGAFFTAKGIEVNKCKEEEFDNAPASKYGRGFAVSTGVSSAVKHHVNGAVDVNPILVDGLTKQGIKTLKSYGQDGAPGNLIEVMSCEGGCLAGPGVINSAKVASSKLKKFVEGS